MAVTSTPTNDKEIVAWIDQVCGASLGPINALSVLPRLDTSDLATTRRQFVDWLGAGSLAVDQAMRDLEGLKKGPHPDSEKLVTAASGVFGQLKVALDKAKAGIEEANPNNPSALAAAFVQVGADLTAVGTVGDDFQGVFVNANLADAEKKAPKCQQVAASNSPPTSTGTP
jgi:hypothetical protein